MDNVDQHYVRRNQQHVRRLPISNNLSRFLFHNAGVLLLERFHLFSDQESSQITYSLPLISCVFNNSTGDFGNARHVSTSMLKMNTILMKPRITGNADL